MELMELDSFWNVKLVASKAIEIELWNLKFRELKVLELNVLRLKVPEFSSFSTKNSGTLSLWKSQFQNLEVLELTAPKLKGCGTQSSRTFRFWNLKVL